MNNLKIKIASAREALRYVLSHFCEPGYTDYPGITETYAAISIQDTIDGGFGFELKENAYCKGVITLYFDDIDEPCKGLTMMTDSQAVQLIDFIQEHREVDTLLIHCFAGVSRSRAVGVFAAEILGTEPVDEKYYNTHVYNTLRRIWREKYE